MDIEGMPSEPFPYTIVDVHHHFWDLQQVHYPWLASKGIVRFFGDPAPIQKDYLVNDLKQDAGSLPLSKSVHIQVGAADDQHLSEAQFVQQHCDANGLGNAIVAFVGLESSEVEVQLDALQKLSRFRGVRQIVGRSPKEDKLTGTGSLLLNDQWLTGLQKLASRRLSFDLQLIPEQMKAAADVIAEVPELPVAICHCGSPWYSQETNPEGWKMWQEGLLRLAQLPNTVCKVSGLSMFNHQWTTTLAPVINHVLSCFGPERVMFGSNFPVDKLHTDYPRLWWAYLGILESSELNLKQKEITQMLSKNGENFYQI